MSARLQLRRVLRVPLGRYAFGVALVLVAGIGRWALNPVLGAQALLLPFVVPVLLASWYGGTGPGVLAIVLSVACASLPVFPREPGGAFFTDVHLGLFAAEGMLVVALTKAVRDARTATETAHRDKDRFLAAVSHDLRAPLNTILGWTWQLRRRQDDADFVGRSLDGIERAAHVQMRLVGDLLDLSRATTGKLTIQPQETGLARLLNGCADAVRLAADRRQISIEVMLDRADAVVFVDPVRFDQVVTNLLNNAVKFTLPGGAITITATCARGLEIRVRDTGIGIPRDHLARVFEPFRQVDEKRDTTSGGLGLGLAIARRIVELHGGAITAASDGPGAGSTFTIRLPAARVRLASAASAQFEADERGREYEGR